jgi:cytochrome c oxidase cbb3-type subunit 2
MSARVWLLLLGAVAIMIFAVLVLVALPAAMLVHVKPPPGLAPYTELQARGREVYIAEGCVYCHTQQVRDPLLTSDTARGWGRASVPADYVYDAPHLLGTMRTGPDLTNVGARLPDRRWHLLHLFQPRSLVDWSIMPSFRALFTVKPAAKPGDLVLTVPAPWAPPSGVVVASEDAIALADYLVGLRHDYPVPVDATTP